MKFNLLVFLCLILSSCSKRPDLEIIGKWKVSSVKVENSTLLPHQRLELNEELSSMVFDINDKGAIIYSNFYRTGAHGNWQLNQKKDSIFFNYKFNGAQIQDNFKISTSKNELTFSSGDFEGTKEIILSLGKE